MLKISIPNAAALGSICLIFSIRINQNSFMNYFFSSLFWISRSTLTPIASIGLTLPDLFSPPTIRIEGTCTFASSAATPILVLYFHSAASCGERPAATFRRLASASA